MIGLNQRHIHSINTWLNLYSSNKRSTSSFDDISITAIPLNITDDSTYGSRGFGPDGRAIYYVVTDASPEMAGDMLGVTSVPLYENLAGTPAAVHLYQFANGINGTGPLGFQAGIGGANSTDRNYSPMWKISFIEWKDPSKARILETVDDVIAMQKSGMINITPALDGKHVVNCPFFGQSMVVEHVTKLS